MKKVNLKKVEAVDVEFEEVVEEVTEVKTTEVNYDEMIANLEAKIKDVKAYQSFINLVSMSDYPFQFETPKQGDKGKMILNKVVKRTKSGMIDADVFEIITRGEDNYPDEIKWIERKRYTQEGFKMGKDQARYSLSMYSGQLDEVITERDSKLASKSETANE